MAELVIRLVLDDVDTLRVDPWEAADHLLRTDLPSFESGKRYGVEYDVAGRFLSAEWVDRAPGVPVIDGLELYAYVGEDEHGSGEVGLKAGVARAGVIPLVATKREKLDRDEFREQLQAQADAFGKTIRLVRWAPVEQVLVIEPRGS